MDWRLTLSSRRKRVAVLVSRQDHALLELLWTWQRGDLRADVIAVISNHEDLGPAIAPFAVPFVHVPNDAAVRREAEARMLGLLEGKADLVVLARYMQIVSADFVARFPNAIINIHHSFLPAFAGADPYRQASHRGGKIVGATADYGAAEPGARPIIQEEPRRGAHRRS